MDAEWFSDQQFLVQRKSSVLTPKERKILTLRFGIGEEKHHTLKEIGQIFNVSGGRIWKIQNRALGKLWWFGKSSELIPDDLFFSDLSPKRVEELIRESDKVLPNILEMPYFLAFSYRKNGFSRFS